MQKALIRVPREAQAGEVITVKVLIRHPMESGHRRDRRGERIPRSIIHSFTAHYGGNEVMRIDLLPGIAANPYLEFRMMARKSGDILFTWTDDEGNTHTQKESIQVK